MLGSEYHDKINWHINDVRYVVLGLDTKNNAGCTVVDKAVFTYDKGEDEEKNSDGNRKQPLTNPIGGNCGWEK